MCLKSDFMKKMILFHCLGKLQGLPDAINMTGRMNIQMCLMEKRGLLLIILNFPEDGQDLIWVERCRQTVLYTPRNRDNYIRPGDIYELYYCDRYWKSAGRIKATVDSLVYRGIPQNVLLFLRNHTRGVDERVFVYEKGEQLWK